MPLESSKNVTVLNSILDVFKAIRMAKAKTRKLSESKVIVWGLQPETLSVDLLGKVSY